MHKSAGRKSNAKVIVSLAFTINLVICCSTWTSAAADPAGQPTTSSSVTVSSIDGHEVQQAAGNKSLLVQTVSHKSPQHSRQFGDTINDIQIECNSDNIVVTLNTNHGFNGMIYPKGLSKNSTCMTEYHQTSSNITYYLPLRSCNTMSSDVEDGVEYFNTVMVQPHRRLVTNQGRGYHIRCRYQTKERTITNQYQQLSVNLTHSTPSVVGSVSMPSCSMKIYSSNDLTKEVAAENVRIGDELNLVISLDDQDVYGMLVTNCLVRDGMNWGEQPLLDDHGCPVDEEIMPQFVYSHNLTRASVSFQAHKFPYTSSVYYQCNVRLCFREGGCQHIPPNCNAIPSYAKQRTGAGATNTNEIGRRKRWVDGGELDGVASEEILVKPPEAIAKSMSLEVYSGLRVDESEPLANADAQPEAASLIASSDGDPLLMAASDDSEATSSTGDGELLQPENPPPAPGAKQQVAGGAKQSEKDFCLSLRKFAIAISLASLILMAAILIIIACLIQRRKRRKLAEEAEEQHRNHIQNSMMYNHSPYTNRAYCRE